MKPNLFRQQTSCPEDFFSLSLAYVLNLFPATAKRFLQRVALLSGRNPEYFGNFMQCEFVGQEYLANHMHSRPDLMITTDRYSLYFENKLESPLSLEQMRRHSLLVTQEKKAHLLFVSNIQHDCPELKTLTRYLCPEHADHFLWQDFASVFSSAARKNSLADRILSDFRTAMRTNGMIGRMIAGASGSLYTGGSDAMHLALHQLWDVMHDLGFKLTRKIGREHTIRAYPVKHLQYPLLNPRFIPTAIAFGEYLDRELLKIDVYSKGAAQPLDRKLDRFVSDVNCEYVSLTVNDTADDGFNFHGMFLMPLLFKGKGKTMEIDFSSLRPQLKRVLDFCKSH